MATRHGDELRLLFAGQKRLAFANAAVRPLGQVLRVATVGDRQDVLCVRPSRDVFTLFEVTDGVVHRRARCEPVCLPVACVSACVCSRDT